jgi:hypothetical protein
VTLQEFQLLKKLLALTTSPVDAEALAALRRVNALLKQCDVDWNLILSKTVKVIAAAEPLDEGPGSTKSFRAADDSVDNDFDDDLQLALDSSSGSFRDVLLSIEAQYRDGRALSPRQREVVRDAAERAAERHSGGRVR